MGIKKKKLTRGLTLTQMFVGKTILDTQENLKIQMILQKQPRLCEGNLENQIIAQKICLGEKT